MFFTPLINLLKNHQLHIKTHTATVKHNTIVNTYGVTANVANKLKLLTNLILTRVTQSTNTDAFTAPSFKCHLFFSLPSLKILYTMQ